MGTMAGEIHAPHNFSVRRLDGSQLHGEGKVGGFARAFLAFGVWALAVWIDRLMWWETPQNDGK